MTDSADWNAEKVSSGSVSLNLCLLSKGLESQAILGLCGYKDS